MAVYWLLRALRRERAENINSSIAKEALQKALADTGNGVLAWRNHDDVARGLSSIYRR